MMPAPKGFNPHSRGNTKRAIRAERKVANGYKRKGWKVERAGWGSDFKASKNGRNIRIEVKTGDGRITDKQAGLMRRMGSDYKVHHFPSPYHKGRSY